MVIFGNVSSQVIKWLRRKMEMALEFRNGLVASAKIKWCFKRVL